ncbi:hypothetical protein PAXINDRAFT_169050 [Paxillus involutus ATCC 200175]|uniref:MI domain-containing protein n=1 Tax=Paxillus involutus ATCC 200175 TaxID=664439 RepID=A0A0C9U895_PAXIN|nr:hypothetical protein PAXINDRAFT_169050 [Paxillus involutus ATCC 200175]
MSKASTASGKTPTPLPSQSAWAKGPPQNSSSSSAPSPRSQSPAPSHAPSPITASHSRRPSALGQGVPIKEGVSVPRSNVGSVRQGSAVTFGSIDDVAAPLSSSPAATPVVKTESVKSFGSVPATTSNHVNGKALAPASTAGSSKLPARPASSTTSSNVTSASTTPATTTATTSTTVKPALGKADIAKLFQGSSSSSQPSSDTSSPSTRPSNLPPHHQPSSSGQHPPQPPPQSQLGAHQYTPFVPGMRQQQGSNGPRSPAFSRPVPNGAGAPPRPMGGPGGPGGPPIPASPRLAPHHSHQHPHQPPAGVPPQQVPMQPMHWSPYYYPVDPYGQPASPWFYPAHAMHQQPHPPHTPHPPSAGPQGPPHPGIAMSPRNPPPTLPPGTPTMTHAVPHTPHTPQPPPQHSHQPSGSIGVSSPPPTPSTATGPGLRSLNTNASAFVPTNRPPKAIVIKNEDGTEVNLESLKKHSPQPPNVPIPPPSPVVTSRRTASVRIESEESKRKREEQVRLEQEKKEAAERAEREEHERKRKEEEEAKRKEEEEVKRREEEEKERLRQEEEEKERLRKEEDEQKRKIEEARLEEERKKAQEEKELAEREAEERQQKDALEREAAQLEAEEAEDIIESPVEECREPEEGEVIENGELAEPHVNGDSVSKPAKSQKEVLRIDTSSMPPPLEIPRRRPGPLDISAAKRDNSAAPLSALATAKNIERLQDVEYPDGVKSPREDLNKDAKDGKFRYDRDFLMQFMQLCKEKPLNLPPLDILGIEPVDQTSFNMTRGGSGRHRQASGTMTPSTARQNSVGLGITPFAGKTGASPSPFAMGQFSTPTSKLTSEERFMLSTGVRSASVGGPPANMQFRATAMTRTPSQGGPGGHPMGSNRTRSKRGERRNETNKVVLPQQGQGYGFGAPGAMPILGAALEPVAPLEVSANRWVAASTSRKPIAPDADSPELVDRKVRSLLNKLSMEKFDSISDQIITWANKSENEKDGRTLIQVIRLVFEKATDEAAWSEMYARLCRKMMETISPEVQDDGIKNTDGKPIAGGQLFRKYLLNRCQEDFERGWFAKEATAAAAAAKASVDQAVKAANDKQGEESELYSEEYYAAQKAKRQGLGLIKFIGELFKLQMLTERIMHECVKKLLGNVENPEEEEIESLCQLLKTVGQQLDVPKARAHMDVYFARMKELCKSLNVSPRMQFMLQDVIELRERRWVGRSAVAAPTTIAAVHEAAAKEKAAAEQNYQRQISMSRGGSRRGGDRNAESGPDGWTTAGSAVPRPPPKAGDLSQFGKISKGAPMVMGPGSVFAGKKDTKRDSLSRTNSSSNMFSMLSQNPELAADAIAKASRPPSRRPSADFGQTGLPELPMLQRKKLQLLPRTRPSTEETAPPASEEEPEAPAHVSEADVKKQIDEDVKEFFAVRNLEEADVYFTKLTEEHRFRLVDKLVASALESKEVDALLVGGFFAQVASKGQCSLEIFEAGFMPMAEFLDDIAIDAPNAFKYMAIMLKGAGFDKDDERLGRIAGKSIDSDKLLQLVSSC